MFVVRCIFGRLREYIHDKMDGKKEYYMTNLEGVNCKRLVSLSRFAIHAFFAIL